jgi:hypothetical protein
MPTVTRAFLARHYLVSYVGRNPAGAMIGRSEVTVGYRLDSLAKINKTETALRLAGVEDAHIINIILLRRTLFGRIKGQLI